MDIDCKASHQGLCYEDHGSKDSRPAPVSGSTAGPVADSQCQEKDGMPLLEDKHVVPEEQDTEVKEEGRKEADEKEEEETGVPYDRGWSWMVPYDRGWSWMVPYDRGWSWMVPYDRGWSWMVVFGMFINAALLAGYVKSSGLFFVQLLKEFNAPTTHTALLFAIRFAVYSVSGLYVMNVCLGLYSSRTLVFIGGCLTALSAILSAVASQLTLLICSFSILLGIGMSMFPPGEVLIGHYFKKRRSLALALAKCGISVGNVAIPPLVSYLLAEYGLSGTLLLLGGVCLHCLPAAMLLRPTSFYTMRHTRRICRTSGGVDDGGSRPQPSLLKQVNGDDGVLSADVEKVRRETSSSVVTAAAVFDEGSHLKPSRKSPTTQGLSARQRRVDELTADLAALSNSNSEICLKPSRDVPLRKRTYSEPPKRFDQAHRTVAEDRLNVLDAISQSSVVRYVSMTSLNASLGLLPQVSANKKNKPRPTALKSVDSSIGVEQPVTNDNSSTNSSRNRCVRFLSFLWRCPKKLVFMLDFSLFRSPLFRLLIMYMMFFNFVNIVLDYLPAVARENGVTESQSALLLSIIGGLDLLSRLLSGFLANTRLLRVSTMIIITLVILSVVTQFVRFMTTFDHFLIFAAVQGLFGGVGNCLFPVLIIEFVGLENLGKCMGFCQLVIGAAMTAIYPFLGYLRDITGSFTTVFHVIGAGMLVSAGLLCLEGPVRRLESRSQYKVQTQGQDAGRDFELVVDCDSKG